MYFTLFLVLNLTWPSSFPDHAISGRVSRPPLTSSGTATPSYSWESCHALASFSTATIFTALHPLKAASPGNKTVNFNIALCGCSCYCPPMGICSSTPPRRGSMSPTLSYKFPHSLNKEGQSEHICPLSGMSQKSNSCWPLFQTHCPVCPKGSLDELQLIYTNSTSYRECRARMLHSPVLWLWHKCNLLLRTGSYY